MTAPAADATIGINNHEGVGLRTINQHHREGDFDLLRFFYITEEGREYLALRAQLESEALT